MHLETIAELWAALMSGLGYANSPIRQDASTSLGG
jgi:hypothetical protein